MKVRARIRTRRTFEILEGRWLLAGAPVAPTIAGPEEVGANLNTTFNFSGFNAISVADRDFGQVGKNGTTEQLTLTVTHGTLDLANTFNMFVSGNGTNTLTITTDPTDMPALPTSTPT